MNNMKQLALSSAISIVLIVLLPLLSGCGKSGPTILNVDCIPTDNTAVITWDTNVDATSQVEYGTTAEYGESTDETTTLVKAHSVDLTGLTPGYHLSLPDEVNGC